MTDAGGRDPLREASLGAATPCTGVVVHRFDLSNTAIMPRWIRATAHPGDLLEVERLPRVTARMRLGGSRALLRATLAEALGGEPAKLAIEHGPHGKPRLGGAGPAFNVSHSLDRLLVAVSTSNEVGVDVEMRDVARDRAGIARAVLSEADLDALGAECEERAFLRIWTAKEAALKALGVGLQHPMGDVELSAEAFATLGDDAWRPGEAKIGDGVFALYDVSLDDDVACLAVRD